MTSENNASPEQQLNQTIGTWLQKRQELIVLYCTLCGVRELSKSSEEQARVLKQLKSFCEILVDYLSAGHFEIFETIFDLNEDKVIAKEAFQNNYPNIEASTPKLLDFNDVYDTDEHSQNALSQLPDQLSAIGETLTTRFDLEDKIISIQRS